MRSRSNKISIIIPAVNEDRYIQQTLDTLYAVEDKKKFEVIIVDDFSTNPIEVKQLGVKVIRNHTWLGRPKSIEVGLAEAKHENFVVLNARMVFTMPWIDRYCEELKQNEMICATCIYLNADNQVPTPESNRKYGATIKYLDNKRLPVLNLTTNSECPEDGYVDVCFGATTATTKKWWKHIHGLKGLHVWGSADGFISLKTWMAGGKCKVLQDVEIGNIFRNTQHYAADPIATVYNRMYVVYTLLPIAMRDKLVYAMRKCEGFENALNWYVNTMGQMEKERQYYQSIQKKSIINHIKN